MGRRLAGSKKPLCAWGGSAGAHWATLAATRANYNCVIAIGLPTLLVPGGDTKSATTLESLIQVAFGNKKQRKRWSPIPFVKRLQGPVLTSTSANDLLTPPANARQLKRANPSKVQVQILALGSVNCPFGHGTADCQAVEAFSRQELAFVERARKALKP
jgi:pimeloyl-ACP methyl ester carboxylesterase